MNRIFPPIAAALALTLTAAFAAPRDGAVAAMLALPPKYSNGILKVYGNGGNPQPAVWNIIARDKDNLGSIRRITVSGGQLIKDTASFNMGQMFRNDEYFYPQSIAVDSAQAFAIASKYAAANNTRLGSVNYSLVDQGPDVDPMWFLDCRNPAGKRIGKLSIIATNGRVVSANGFARSP